MQKIKVSFDTWIQLLGMVGVLGGLIFVGLEMKQSQTIALAAQQQARTEVFTDLMNSLTVSGVSYEGLLGPSEKSPQEIIATSNLSNSMLWVFENDFLQYRFGLVDETLWQSKLNLMIQMFSSCQGMEVFNNRKRGLDKNLLALMEESLPADCLTDEELRRMLLGGDSSF
jgi:hypothetical protein